MYGLREQLEEFALHMNPGTTKGKHRTAIFDTLEVTRLIEALIQEERLRLISLIEEKLPKFSEMPKGYNVDQMEGFRDAMIKVTNILKGLKK